MKRTLAYEVFNVSGLDGRKARQTTYGSQSLFIITHNLCDPLRSSHCTPSSKSSLHFWLIFSCGKTSANPCGTPGYLMKKSNKKSIGVR